MNERSKDENQLRLRHESYSARFSATPSEGYKLSSTSVHLNQFKILLKYCTYARCITFSCLVLFSIGIGLIFAYLSTNHSDTSHYSKPMPKLMPPDPDVEPLPSSSILHVFQHGAVCSDSDVCSKIGRDMFHHGGNIMDSALATQLCNGITAMHSLGLGGGFLMNVFIKAENKAYTIDARELAPLAATEDIFHSAQTGHMTTPLAIGVPGEVLGYWEAYRRFGSMTWKEIFEPSIKICENGFTLSRHMFDSLYVNDKVREDFHMSATFVNKETNDFHPMGKHIYPPKELCNTYRLLASNGALDFYNGSIAKMLIEDLKDIGSIVTAEDLSSFKVDWHDSIPVDIDGHIMYAVPPTGSGTILALIINTLRGYNFTHESISTIENSKLTNHRIIESFKFAFAKRSLLGDTKFVDLTELIRNFTLPNYGDFIRSQINDNITYANPKHYGARFWSKSDNGTSHLSIIAPNGDAVSITSSINFYFGCGQSGKRTGIIFNSGMDDFSVPDSRLNYFGLPSSKPNFIQPGKRAMSSMCPTIITDDLGNVSLVIGAAGGTKIISAIALVIMRLLWFGQNIKEAIDAPRIHHQLVPNEIQYEFGNLQQIIKDLEHKGHRTVRYRERGTIICGIAKNKTALYANADYRKKGDVVGL